jgi:hypothetical protein
VAGLNSGRKEEEEEADDTKTTMSVLSQEVKLESEDGSLNLR